MNRKSRRQAEREAAKRGKQKPALYTAISATKINTNSSNILPPHAVNSSETEYERNTRQAENIIRRGVEAKRAGQYQEAKRLYNQAIAIAPWYLHVYYALGKICYILGEREESLRSYTVASHLAIGLGDAQDLEPETGN